MWNCHQGLGSVWVCWILLDQNRRQPLAYLGRWMEVELPPGPRQCLAAVSGRLTIIAYFSCSVVEYGLSPPKSGRPDLVPDGSLLGDGAFFEYC
ncbi:heparan-alpha-glucosaminideN-acetyltransferase-like protein [Cricetulus griseus]|uniref:Heparan-alpha-glucosaminideN-acetyltransferase-like protein n=1 Tax=Cricetulus griseus TaxID=10029 RepID=A0A061IBI4_CRIGR|nr:heparan-alpha-glucosaminideN-acetyltransferase-like protein [Cricetulus griseus]